MAIGKDIKDLYDLLVKQNLTDKSFDEFKVAAEDENYRDKVYSVLVNRNLYDGEKTQFDDNYFFEFSPAATKKKKDESDGTFQEEDMEFTSDTQDPNGLSESSENQNEVDPRADILNPFEASSSSLPPVPEGLKNPVGTKYGANVQVGEKDTWLEEMLGKNTVTDFFGDMWRAGQQGLGQGATIDDALNLYASGSSISEEDLQEYIKSVEEMESFGMSDEMKSFNKIYEKNGGGVLGFVLGAGQNPSILGQLFVSSIASMVNPAVAAGAGAGAATGAAVGGAAGAAGGPLAALTAAGGAVTGSLMGAGATLETGLSFTEFLKEEVDKKGLTFDQEGIRSVLEDPEALQSIRNRSASRGIAIGAIDGLTRGVAGKLAGKGVKAAKAAGKTVTKGMKGKAALGAALIEGVGGSTGEVAGRVVSGQEMDTAEILFEGVTGQASSVLSVPQAVTGKTVVELVAGEKGAKVQSQIDNLKSELGLGSLVSKGVNVFKPPKYGIKDNSGNVTKLSKAEILDFVSTSTLDEIRTMQFEITNDPELSAIVQAKKQKAQIGTEIPFFIEGEDRAKMVALEQEKANMKDPDLKVNKKRLSDIEAELDAIIDK